MLKFGRQLTGIFACKISSQKVPCDVVLKNIVTIELKQFSYLRESGVRLLIKAK